MEYRKDIDGLRAFAVIPVILFHAGISTFRGGFLGVDVFFIISGYLITSIVVSEKSKGAFSLLQFYERRARRILPALYFALTISTMIAIAIMLPAQLKEYGQSMVASVLFSANIFFWLKTDYWAQSAELTPLLHIWSLGVEEQFYFFFPLLVIYCSTKNLKRALWAVLLISFYGMLYARGTGHISESFYLLPFRAWELVIGSIAAIYKPPEPITSNAYLKSLAFACLIWSYTAADGVLPIAIQYAIPSISSYLIISIQTKDDPITKLLSHPIFVYTGVISYSLYLFHQPIFSLARIAEYGSLNNFQLSICLALTFFAATLSYHQIENRFRGKKSINNHAMLTTLSAFAALLITTGIYLHTSNGLKGYKLAKLSPASQSTFLKFEESLKSRAEYWQQTLSGSGENFNHSDKKRILFVGDSLSEDLYVASSLSQELNNRAQLRHISFDDECIKHLSTNGNETGLDSLPCRNEVERFLNSSLAKESDTIVIAEAWLSNAKYLRDFLELRPVKGKQIIIYLSHSFTDMSSLLLYSDKSELNTSSTAFKEFVFMNRHQRTMSANNTLQEVANKLNLKTINSFNHFCNATTKQCTVIDQSGTPMIIDQTHLSKSGAVEFSAWLSNEIISNLNLQNFH